MFQLTRPRGTRPYFIHADGDSMMFQLTRPRGTRLFVVCHGFTSQSFNSRVRGGRDRQRNADRGRADSFNSRVRGGRDLYLPRYDASLTLVSTHASAGDATLSRGKISGPKVFQLTRPRGTRRASISLFWASCVSTHASAGDATQTTYGT